MESYHSYYSTDIAKSGMVEMELIMTAIQATAFWKS